MLLFCAEDKLRLAGRWRDRVVGKAGEMGSDLSEDSWLGGDGKCWEWLVFAGALLFANRYRLRSTSTTEGHRQPHHESGGGVLWVWGVVKRILVKCSAILTLFPYLNTQCFSTACSLQLDFWDFLPLFYAGFVIFNSIFPLELQGKIIK